MSLLRIPEAEAPEVSVVVVTFNAWEWTQRCLEALVDGTPQPYELIVVDNASTDQTRDRLLDVHGATVVLNGENLGFLVACNQGVARARAPLLLLLNNDAMVEPGWLPALRRQLDADPRVAAAAARLLHLDGRLQEAGSAVWGDGRADSIGDGDDPERAEYRFARDLDFASAACLLVRRAAWVDAGGFDPRFHPAYFEDVDLCMRWRSMGLRVVYEPRATARHKRWASSGSLAAHEMVERNRPLIVERWRAVLGDRPPRPQPFDRASLLVARDALCAERFVVLADDVGAAGSPQAARLDRLRAGWPSARMTLLVRRCTEVEHMEDLFDRGVEVLIGDLEALAAARPLHYTALLVDDGVGQDDAAAVAASQPSATVVRSCELEADRLVAELGAAGVGHEA